MIRIVNALKNYYHILNVTASATTEEIKKAFRKLALQYHPDKNPGNKSAASSFREIKEAYDVLRDRKKRADYNYALYARENSARFVFTPTTAEEILLTAQNVRAKLEASDPFRIDQDAILFELENLLPQQNIQLLQDETDQQLLINLVNTVLACCRLLSLASAKKICATLLTIQPSNTQITKQLSVFIREQTAAHVWARYKVLVALLISILLCTCIYLLNR